MKAYKCDRCGKFFEEYRGQGTAAFFNITRNPSTLKLLDLCPDCNAELQKWIKNGKAESEVDSERSEEYANRD